uniref:von Hippel-Lindau disease tumour suppressor beta domain-containing protein n=1 Tax=Chlamydomonas leiostraca TaxID=1034604 RepID=A0A7S0WVU0_9CHLO|mmetsp:Transcript_31220/g.79601  ORF Transcript_31220/g.79601 Transcript_31220/m.79601 type:complete len:492 (+) Transcript_31220:118-1593(+)
MGHIGPPQEGAGQDSANEELRSTQDDSTADCIIQFVNSTKSKIGYYWVNFDGKEQEYGQLEPGHRVAQHTFTTHPWRVRLLPSKAVVGEHVGPSVVFEALGEQTCKLSPLQVMTQPKAEWGEWRQRADAAGIAILAYDCVGDDAVRIACHVVGRMLEHSPPAVVARLVAHKARVGIIGCRQVTTDVPDHWYMKLSAGGRDIDATTRGLGGTQSCALTTCGEENLTMVDDRSYPSENILVHEFGHTVMNCGLSDSERREIEALYARARESGVYERGIYAMENADEYWAEGTQAWFDATIRTDVNSGVNSRDTLKRLDPGLAALMCRAYGDGPWRYPHDAPRPFSHKRKRAHGEVGSDGGESKASAPSVAVAAPGEVEMDRSRLAATAGAARPGAGLAGLCTPGAACGPASMVWLGPLASCVPTAAAYMPVSPSARISQSVDVGFEEGGSGAGCGASAMVGLASLLQLSGVYALLTRGMAGEQRAAIAVTKQS